MSSAPVATGGVSLKNDLFLGLDFVVGTGLVLVAAMNGCFVPSGILCVLVFLCVVAHGYREWEYSVREDSVFCANAPLLVLNNLTLIGLLAVAASVFRLRIASRS